MARTKVEGQLGFVLHTYPYTESSLIVDFLSREYGRVSLMAKGARRANCAYRGLLLAFQPICVTWQGRGEVKLLTQAEWVGGHPVLLGTLLLCGFYLNELLLKLLPREDPNARLFDGYQAALHCLGAMQQSRELVLRQFEKILLQELGYAVQLTTDVQTQQPVQAADLYCYQYGYGIVRWNAAELGVDEAVLGQTLIDLEENAWRSPRSLLEAKRLMRGVINYYLGSKSLYTRQLLMDLLKF